MITLKIKEGHQTDFTATVKDSDGDAVNLTQYDKVDFVMVNTDGTIVVESEATFIDKTAGEVTYNLQSADVSNAGKFRAYFSFEIGGVKKLASPTDYFIIEITEDLID